MHPLVSRGGVASETCVPTSTAASFNGVVARLGIAQIGRRKSCISSPVCNLPLKNSPASYAFIGLGGDSPS